MALSERERQMLEEMEEAIRAEDPRFASQMNGAHPGGPDRRRVVVGVIGAVAGLGLVLLGINTSLWVGVAGFVLIVASVALAFAPGTPRGRPHLRVVEEDGSVHRHHTPRPRGPKAGRKHPRHGTFMQRMEQRWEHRRQQGQGW